MEKDEIFAGLAVLVLSGVLVYMTKVGWLTLNIFGRHKSNVLANQAIDQKAIAGAGGNPVTLIGGPDIYMANTPWPFGAANGNILPPTSAGLTLPGADQADFLGFAVPA